MKSAVLFLCLLIFSMPCAARETCDLRAAPILLGLKLEMSPDAVQNVFGRDLKIKVKKKGQRTFFQNYIKKPAAGSLLGVRAIYLRFFNARLYQIEIFYENRQDLKTLENITAALAAQLNFPASDWQIKNNRAANECGEISLVADAVLNPHIEITNETIRTAVEESRQKDRK